MTLDLSQVANQIEAMAESLKTKGKDRETNLRFALETIHNKESELDSLKAKIERSKKTTTWLVAGLRDGLVSRHQPVTCPPDFTVIATDGSHIDVDRHSPPRCYLINIGNVILRYGKASEAVLSSKPTLYASDPDLTIADPLGNGEQSIEGALLGIKRAVAECQALASLAENLTAQIPVLALLDGTLVLWGLEAYHDYVKNELLDNGFLKALDKIKGLCQERRIALASYISLPRSTEVVNALRIAVCSDDSPDCDRLCPRGQHSSGRKCSNLDMIQDRDLFMRLLEQGERSATFVSPSSVVQKHYGEHEVCFFYLRVDDEIARVEFPRWVEEEELVDSVHSLLLDQCHRGQGYPVALSESHEQAVLTSTDRQQFKHLIEVALSEQQLSTITSAKSMSKRTRWV
ncbi:DNA double-strand break repair nuclease NurA [Chloroflexota bacterium]